MHDPETTAEIPVDFPVGNTTIIGEFLFSSAYLSAYLGGASSASRNITSLLSSTRLTVQDKSNAIAQAIALGLGQRETQAVATLALAALSSTGADTIKAGFAEVTQSWPATANTA